MDQTETEYTARNWIFSSENLLNMDNIFNIQYIIRLYKLFLCIFVGLFV